MTPPPHRLTSLERLHPLLDRPVLRPVVRLVTRTATGLVQLQIFDRAMTLAAQAFTSIFPVLILSGALPTASGWQTS
jgi:membrane protein